MWSNVRTTVTICENPALVEQAQLSVHSGSLQHAVKLLMQITVAFFKRDLFMDGDNPYS